MKAGIRGPGDLTAVLLTHRHCDHAGNAAWVRKRFGARVYIHEFDAAALEGKVSSPPLCGGTAGNQAFYERWLCQYEDKFPAHCEVDGVFGNQGGDGTFHGFGFRVIPTPGHTEGSVMFHHEASATLFSGDAILSRRAATMRVRKFLAPSDSSLTLASPGFSQDVASCELAVRRYLRHLPPTRCLCSGHGPYRDESVEKELLRLA